MASFESTSVQQKNKNQLYKRVCRGLSDRGFLVPKDNVGDHISNYEKDWYISVFDYNHDHFTQFEETGTVKGIKNVNTDTLVFDFDSVDDLGKAKSDTETLINRLQKEYKVPTSSIQLYYSGNKGFNVLIQMDYTLSPEMCCKLAVNKLGKGLETLDPTMYDAPQILRVTGTRHPKSGLYKIPLDVLAFPVMSIDDIKKTASNMDNIGDFTWDVFTPTQEFLEVPEEPKKVVTLVAPLTVDFTSKPKGWKNCKWAISKGLFKSGERHQALLTLAATARGLGYDKDQAYYLCKSALKAQSNNTGQEEFDKKELWDDIISSSVYSEGWEGGQYTCKKPGWLQKYCNALGSHSCKESDKEGDDEKFLPSKITDIATGFKDFIMHIDENTIKTGITVLDDKLPITIGNSLGVIGAASSGKTALALEILKNTSRSGIISVFASLDMHRNRLFEKLLYKVSGGTSREKVYDDFKNGKEEEYLRRIKEDYGNVYFYDRSCPNVTDIRRYIEEINNSSDKKVKLVMLDYFERVSSERGDETSASKDVAGQLQDLINDYNIALITLVQPNKFSLSGGPDTPILNYTAIKGSSFLYQSFRSIISIWRPFFNPKTKDKDKFMQMAILKNDLGELDMFDFAFEGKTGTIREMSEEEESLLRMWLHEKENREDKNKDWA